MPRRPPRPRTPRRSAPGIDSSKPTPQPKIPPSPTLLTQYQVASREKVKVTREQAQGAPERDETVLQIKYTEHVAKAEKEKMVKEVVRRYDSSNFRTTVDIRPLRTELFKDLTISIASREARRRMFKS